MVKLRESELSVGGIVRQELTSERFFVRQSPFKLTEIEYQSENANENLGFGLRICDTSEYKSLQCLSLSLDQSLGTCKEQRQQRQMKEMIWLPTFC